MDQYLIRDIYIDDYKQVTDIYNSNRQFLLEHLGAELIDEEFVSEEVLSMSKMGFQHESIETTRIYLRKTSTEQREIVDNVVIW